MHRLPIVAGLTVICVACTQLKSGDVAPPNAGPELRETVSPVISDRFGQPASRVIRAPPIRNTVADRFDASTPRDSGQDVSAQALRDASQETVDEAAVVVDASTPLAASTTLHERGGRDAGSPMAMARDDDASTSDSLCPDDTTASCNLGTWPAGIIYYELAAEYGQRSQVREVMNRWEAASAHVVSFVESTTRPSRVKLNPCSNPASHSAPGRNQCLNGCSVALCDAIAHQLGHIIGLRDEQMRDDRGHYLRLTTRCAQADTVATCGSQPDRSDFGAFDYCSTMLYAPELDMTRWDGSAICSADPASACGCDTQAVSNQPSSVDGAAVVELYRLASGWSKFLRTIGSTGVGSIGSAQAPLSELIGTGIEIASDANLSLETWEGGSISMHVRGQDGNFYYRWTDAPSKTWYDWQLWLTAPPGSDSLSDLAVTSWTPGHSDYVVRRGPAVFITSSPIAPEWEFLGGPASLAASTPAITTWGEDRLDVFVRGGDDRIYHRYCSAKCVGAAGTWSDWTAVGDASFRGRPAALARSVGTIDLFAHGSDDQLWTTRFGDGQWAPWSMVVPGKLQWDAACPDCSSPAVGARNNLGLEVYVRGANDMLWVTSWTSDTSWSPYLPLGGALVSSPATVSQVRTTNRMDVVAIMFEEAIAGRRQRGTWWKASPP